MGKWVQGRNNFKEWHFFEHSRTLVPIIGSFGQQIHASLVYWPDPRILKVRPTPLTTCRFDLHVNPDRELSWIIQRWAQEHFWLDASNLEHYKPKTYCWYRGCHGLHVGRICSRDSRKLRWSNFAIYLQMPWAQLPKGAIQRSTLHSELLKGSCRIQRQRNQNYGQVYWPNPQLFGKNLWKQSLWNELYYARSHPWDHFYHRRTQLLRQILPNLYARPEKNYINNRHRHSTEDHDPNKNNWNYGLPSLRHQVKRCSLQARMRINYEKPLGNATNSPIRRHDAQVSFRRLRKRSRMSQGKLQNLFRPSLPLLLLGRCKKSIQSNPKWVLNSKRGRK